MTLRVILLGLLLTISSCQGESNYQQDVTLPDECEYPASCSTCFEDIGSVISMCFDHPDPPVCLGSIIMASSDCPPCLCDMIASQIMPDLVHYLCPVCKNLAECT